MNKIEFLNKFSCVNNNQGEIVWSSPIEARMYVAQNFDATLCSLVEEDGVNRLYEGEIEDNRIGFVIVEAGDYSFPVEGVDWTDVEGDQQSQPEEQEEDNTQDQTATTLTGQQGSGKTSYIAAESAAQNGEGNAESEEDSEHEERETQLPHIKPAVRGEVVFSADSIADLLSPTEEVDGYERARFISVVGVEDPEETVIMDIEFAEVDPVDQIEIIDTGRISDIVEFSQGRYNTDIIPNEITNIPLGTVLLRHDSVVIEGKTYYFSRFQDRSKKKIADFIERAVAELAAGNIVVEPLTTVLETPKGEVKTYKYFLSEVKEIAGRLRKYSPKVVGVEGEFQLVIGQYWSL